MASTPQNTASTHKSSIFRATHHFHIVGYRVPRINGRIRSGDFLAGGHTWALLCDFGEKGDDHLSSITLELVAAGNSKGDVVVAMASLRMDDPRGRWPAAVWRSDGHNVFSKTGKSWKLTLPDLFRGHEARYVEDDCLTILCTVDVLDEKPVAKTESTKRFVVAVPSSPTVSQDLEKLMLPDASSSVPPDVTFLVEQTEIKAHKLVLAMRSSVFAAEFRWHGSASTAGARAIRIDDMSASTFRAMLRFIYTDEMPIKPSKNVARRPSKARRCEAMARDLLVAADRYDLERLRLMCEKILSENLNASTVMSTLLLVRGRKSCRQLEQSCIEHIATHPDVLAAVMATQEYEELKETCSPLILEIVERVAMAMHGLDRNSSLLSEKSSSTFNASEEVHGWHDFKIPNFNAVQRSHGVGQKIHSSPFKVGGYDWVLDVYPSGRSDDAGKYISVFLSLVSDLPKGFPGVRASRCFKIQDPSGTWPLTVKSSSVTLFGGNTARTWGYPKCVGIENAKSKYMASDGSLTIRCEVDVTKEPYTRASTIGARFMVTVPPSEISTQLEQLLASENGSDVAFLVEESEIRAHKLVIAARAPALHEAVVATNNNNSKEDDHAAAMVRVDDMKAAVFKAVLHFIYTDELLPGDGTRLLTGDMLTAACRFGLTRMKAMCENLLCESLSKDNLLATAKLARRHHCKELEDYCIEFVSAPDVAKDLLKTFIGLED
ncbi:BTB/POZ and MATH domain-containing protein 1-like [Triticum aestivum]|nr:BTB/POZ and MATH domain-containing protein 1-like [Triticum aestivum]